MAHVDVHLAAGAITADNGSLIANQVLEAASLEASHRRARLGAIGAGGPLPDPTWRLVIGAAARRTSWR